MLKFFQTFSLVVFSFILIACDQAELSSLFDRNPKSTITANSPVGVDSPRLILDIAALTKAERHDGNLGAGFASIMRQALDQDPLIISAKNDIALSRAKLRTTEANRSTQLKASALGGVEDITDETVGLVAILTADRLLYDGGMLDAKIDAHKFIVKSSEQIYETVRSNRAMQLSHAWIDLERYQDLQELISGRLAVLDPLVLQLEKVATAGVGDVSQVASAQRIVSNILVAETDILENYQQAKIAFLSGFGHLPLKDNYDSSWVSAEVPVTSTRKLVENSPGLLASYWQYRAAEASVVAVSAKDDFTFGLRARLQRPIGGSEKASDESVGFVFTKDFYRGDQLKSQLDQVEADAQAKAALVLARYREAELSILAARQMVKSMDKAMELARANAKRSRVEIDYLRKQLIIGGSTLESVLSAEARLFDAESKEIGFNAERRKAEVTMVSITGYFVKALISGQ